MDFFFLGFAFVKGNSIWYFISIMICLRNSWEKNESEGYIEVYEKGILRVGAEKVWGLYIVWEWYGLEGFVDLRVWKIGGFVEFLILLGYYFIVEVFFLFVGIVMVVVYFEDSLVGLGFCDVK